MTDRTQANSEQLTEWMRQGLLEQYYADITSLKARIAELEANEKAYEEIIGKKTFQEVADRIRELEEALEDIIDSLGYSKNEGKSAAVRECNSHNAWKIAGAALQPKDPTP